MAHDLDKKWRSKDIRILENADFSIMLLCDRVISGLTKAGFKKPSPVQLEAIPIGRFGKDLLVQAKSGTGKTLVFVIVALEMLKRKLFRPQVMILVPTREIATQICSVIQSVGSYFPKLTCGSFIGGLSVTEDIEKAHNCQIVVGTPGRIKQLIAIKALPTNSIRLLVFDEADQLLTFKMKPDIDEIFNSLPTDKQVVATSATYPTKVKKMILQYLRDPHLACLNSKDPTLLGIIQYARIVDFSPMPLLMHKFKLAALEPILKNIRFSQCLVFCNGIQKVETLCRDIKKWGFSTAYISSAKEQSDRLKAIDRLKHFKCKVLVSSDVTARGIDAENVDLVINFDLSHNTETYLHRIGRAGRYGSVGVAISIVDETEVQYLKKMEVAAAFKSYKLPDPVPSDLIQKPTFAAYAIKDQELAEGDAFCKNETNGAVSNGNNVSEESNTVQSKQNLPNIISDENDIVSAKESGTEEVVPENVFEIVCSESNANENNHLNIETKSETCCLVSSELSGDENIGEKMGNSTEEAKSESASQNEILNNINLDIKTNFNSNGGKNSEMCTCTSANIDSISVALSDSKNSEIGSCTSTQKDSISGILTDSKISEVSCCTSVNKDCVLSTNEKSSDISVKDLPQSFGNQNVENCTKDAELSTDNVNDIELGGSLDENEISQAITTFIHKYEANKNRKSPVSESINEFDIMESSLTKNSCTKSISIKMLNDLNSKKCDYFYELFKKVQEDNNKDKVQKNINEIAVMSVQNEVCEEEKKISSEVTIEDNNLQNVHSKMNHAFDLPNYEQSNVDALKCVEKPKLENTPECIDQPILESTSDLVNKPRLESTLHFIDESKFKFIPIFDATKCEENQDKSKSFFEEISDESDSEIESDLKKADFDISHHSSKYSESDSESSSDTSESSSDISESSSDISESSSDISESSSSSTSKDELDKSYVKNFRGNKCVQRNQNSSLDISSSESSSVHSIYYGKGKSKNAKEHKYYKSHHHSRSVKAYNQPPQFYSSNSYIHPPPFIPSKVYRQPHSICSENKKYVPRKRYNVVKRNNPGHSLYSGQHSAACFMPSVHKCHPLSHKVASCKQPLICAQWYETFYNQWMHIQRCCNSTY